MDATTIEAIVKFIVVPICAACALLALCWFMKD